MTTKTTTREEGREMNAFIKFNKGVLRIPLGWRLWVGFLVAMNFLAPLFFIGEFEAQITLGAFFASMVSMSVLTGVTGFSRLVGLGHVFWIPLIAFLATRLPGIPIDSAFGAWVRVLIAANAVSLVADAADAFRYAAGDRAETVTFS